MAKLTTEEYRQKLYKVNKDVELLSEYNGTHKYITVKCLKCNNIFQTHASSLLQKHGCPKCANNKRHLNQKMSHSEFVQRVHDKLPNIVIKSKYYNSFSYVDVECITCGNSYKSLAANLLKGYGCKSCYLKSRKRDISDFEKEVRAINKDIIVGDDYVDGKTKCTFICKICGYERSVLPNNFLSTGCKCIKCEGHVKKSTDEYKKIVYSKNPNINVLSEYEATLKNTKYSCNKCGSHWEEQPYTLEVRGYRCKYCETVSSKLESDAEEFLINNGINYVAQHKFDDLVGVGGRRLSYDFFLPDFNMLIECQGKQHYAAINYFGGEQQFETQKEHDSRKRNYASENGYTLLEIPYYHAEHVNEILQQYIGN